MIESLELVVKYRFLHEWREELALSSDFLYYGLTTLLGRQTLGQEYCGVQLIDSSKKFPSKIRRICYIVLACVGPYVL